MVPQTSLPSLVLTKTKLRVLTINLTIVPTFNTTQSKTYIYRQVFVTKLFQTPMRHSVNGLTLKAYSSSLFCILDLDHYRNRNQVQEKEENLRVVMFHVFLNTSYLIRYVDTHIEQSLWSLYNEKEIGPARLRL